MATERLVKWSKESQEFFEKAEDNSVTLDLVISFGCASQTGEGFEELVNTINSESIKRKVKKVIITDTSYLYRHGIQNFQKYSDISIPTVWFKNNEKVIEKLRIPKEIKPWAEYLDTETFKKWYQKIMIDFAGDEKGNGINLEFRKVVLDKANSEILKGAFTIQACVEFILEECAYTCAFFNNVNMIYPMNLGGPLDFVDKYYKLNIKILNYRTSNHEQSCRHRRESIKDKINQQIISFVTEESINVNFFVIDKAGSFIYKNESCNTDIEHNDAKRLPFHVWENTEYVLQTGKKINREETSHEGKVYLTVKSPLVINGKVEGVIGLAVDITDRKKKEELENRLKMREELYKIAKEVSHDIASPVMSLKIIEEMYKGKLKDEDERMLNTAIRSIEDMAWKMLSKYRINKNEEIGRREDVVEKEEEGYINVKESMKDIVENMRYRSKGEEVEIKIEREEGIVYIKGDNTDFRRMMVNVIKNGVEAIEGKKGEIEVGYEEKGEEVEIRVKDNGKGMSRCMVEKLERGEEVGTTKKEGNGIGMGQVMGVIREMRGKIKIESREGEGTEFIFTFPKAEKPA